MADGSVDLAIRIPIDTSQLAGGVAALRDLAVAEKAAAETVKEMERAHLAAASATLRLQDIATKGNTIAGLTLNYQRLNEEIKQLALTEGNAALATEAMSNATRQFASDVAKAHAAAGNGVPQFAKFDDVMRTAGTTATRSSGSMVNLVRQINDVGVMAAMGASPLQILAMQGEQLAFAAKEAGFTTAKLATALPLLASVAGIVAVAAAAAGTAWAVYGNWAADGAMATERAREAMIDAGREAAILGTALSDAAAKGWEKFKDAAAETDSKLETLTGTIGKASAAANKDVQTLKEEAAPALLELGRRQVEITRALNEAVAESNRGGSGAAEAAALASDLRPKLAAVTAELKERKAALKDATENTLALGAATDANTAADERARAAAEALAEAKRRQAEADRKEREEKAAAKEAAKLHLAAIEAEVSGIGAFYDVAERGSSVLPNIAEKIEAMIPSRVLSATEQLTLIQTDLALALSDGSITLDQYNFQMERLAVATDAASAAEARRKLASVSQGVTTATSGPSGVMGAVSQAGPWGAIIAAIVGALENGLADLGDTFNDFTMNFNNAIGSLGDTLGDNLGRWLETGTETAIKMVPDLISGIAENIGPIFEGLINGLAEAIPAIIRALIIDLPSAINSIIPSLISAIFDGDMWKDAGKSLVEGFIQSFTSVEGANGKTDFWSVADKVLFGGIFNTIGGAFSGKAGGGYVAESGLYPLHKGEEVYNRSRVQSAEQQSRGAMGGRGRMMGSGGRAYIEVDLESLSSTLTDAGRRGLTFGAP